MSASIRDLWQRDSKLPFQKLEEDTIVVDPARREVHLLNPTATRLWELLAAPRSLDDLVTVLSDEYDAPLGEAARGHRSVGSRAHRQGRAGASMTAPAVARTVCEDDLVLAAPDGYAAISAAQQRAFETLVPLNTTLELTTDCNIRCLPLLQLRPRRASAWRPAVLAAAGQPAHRFRSRRSSR